MRKGGGWKLNEQPDRPGSPAVPQGGKDAQSTSCCIIREQFHRDIQTCAVCDANISGHWGRAMIGDDPCRTSRAGVWSN